MRTYSISNEEREERKAAIEKEFASNLSTADREAWDRGDCTEHVRDLMDKFSVEAFELCDGGTEVIISAFRAGHALNVSSQIKKILALVSLKTKEE